MDYSLCNNITGAPRGGLPVWGTVQFDVAYQVYDGYQAQPLKRSIRPKFKGAGGGTAMDYSLCNNITGCTPWWIIRVSGYPVVRKNVIRPRRLPMTRPYDGVKGERL